jgi:hypothetical protein
MYKGRQDRENVGMKRLDNRWKKVVLLLNKQKALYDRIS